jgi:hypothetical protein
MNITPGPWEYHRQHTEDRGDNYGIKAPAPHHWVVPPLNINPVDAMLISAAPDLLHALIELRAMCERQVDFNDDGDGRIFERVSFAISKAIQHPW